MVRILHGDVIDKLRCLDTESVHLCVTSIPYWGLRNYDIPDSIWGGSPMCAHEWGDAIPGSNRGGSGTPNGRNNYGEGYGRDSERGAWCLRCGCWRGQLGLEPTSDLFLEHIVLVFQHIRRVLRPEGTLWLNVGDSYANPSQSGGGDPTIGTRNLGGARQPKLGVPDNLKPKDLCMMPARVALALQAEGWYLRSQIPWIKQTAMPESVTDRPTSAIEYIYQFSKSEACYYDREAVRIAASRGASGNKARKYRDDYGGNPEHNSHTGFSVPWEGTTRARRNSDWFMESFKGLLPDENGDPLAMLVNPQPFSIEMCKQCKTCYQQKEYRKLVQMDGNGARVCACGAVAWVSHFATFPEKLVEPIVLAGTSDHGCCGTVLARAWRLKHNLTPEQSQRVAQYFESRKP